MNMKRYLSAFVFISLVIFTPLRAEVFTTLDGENYTEATLKRVEPDGIVIGYPDGIRKLKFQNLPPEVCAKYGYNPEWEAKYVAERQSNDVVAYQAAIPVAAQPTPQKTVISPSIVSNPVAPSIPQVASTTEPPSLIGKIWDWIISFLKKFFPWAFSKPSPTPSPTPPPTPPTTPEQIVGGVLSKTTIQATELGMVCSRFPEITYPILAHRPIKVTGLVEKIEVAGLDYDKAEITLEQSGSQHITILCNLKKYNELYNSDTSCEKLWNNCETSWKIIGRQLFFLVRSKDTSVRL